ncbi:unnamed protein product [Arabidopsis lyrata]|uniref:uncharacterized protein LOC110231147 n=1 Tax=Arabidopsis lyrata subsp. lyrata TaxID=81972 RepID=UPI000A29B0C3|nr:uncharacterized protein LOC110231147 [Arabidopsis lyrata subsp. lyrata]CAH8256052.1 unnamed protein product [Arabidopsis lyrata]|eukprot:XP_020891791.1 uncharacterized protein LOC110231147 [Arabidopsis lyrata subsp. lyrata]
MDFSLWKDIHTISAIQDPGKLLEKKNAQYNSQEELHSQSSLYCYVDASWIDSNRNAGIGWILTDAQGRKLLKGSSAIDPTNSVLEAEAIALSQAVFQIKRLNYKHVVFSGDSASLYRYLEKVGISCNKKSGILEIQRHLDDIISLAKDHYSFKHVARNANSLADALAKAARTNNSPYVITWDH